MVKYEEFEDMLLSYKKLQEDFSELNGFGFDFYEGKYELDKNTSKLFDNILNILFTIEGVDWISWFIFENDWGNKRWGESPTFNFNTGEIINRKYQDNYGAHDDEGNPICFDIPSLFEYVKQYLK
jgi:hypothetical protein